MAGNSVLWAYGRHSRVCSAVVSRACRRRGRTGCGGEGGSPTFDLVSKGPPTKRPPPHTAAGTYPPRWDSDDLFECEETADGRRGTSGGLLLQFMGYSIIRVRTTTLCYSCLIRFLLIEREKLYTNRNSQTRK